MCPLEFGIYYLSQHTLAMLTSCAVCGLGSGDSGCGTKQIFTSTCGTIDIQRGPQQDQNCLWTISVPDGFVISATFTRFHIAETGDIHYSKITFRKAAIFIAQYGLQLTMGFVVSSIADVTVNNIA